MRLTVKILLASLMSFSPTGVVLAEVPGQVIAARDTTTGWTAVMSAADGSNFTKVNCGGDLTHQGSPRYFLDTIQTGHPLPGGLLDTELAAFNDDCTEAIILTNTPSIQFSIPRWSPDGQSIAVYGIEYNLETGEVVEQGLYLADVLRDDSERPAGIADLHLVIVGHGIVPASWSGDGQRLAYVAAMPDGKGGSQGDIFVYDLGTSISSNVTNTPNFREDHPAYSPVDGRIAFTRQVAVRGGYRYDIFTIQDLGGAEVQVTSKSTASNPQNKNPSFSPDGLYLSFVSGDPWKRFDIYRMKANGSGKTVNLTYRRPGNFESNVWRK